MQASVQIFTPTAIVGDCDRARRLVTEELLRENGYAIISCSTVQETIRRLDRLPFVPCLLASSCWLEDEELLPALQFRYRQQDIPLPRLILWAPRGLRSVPEYAALLREVYAVVFSEPVDLDAVLAVARAFAILPGQN